jgi:hypothetical protein
MLFGVIAVAFLALAPISGARAADFIDEDESKFQMRLEGVFWRLDSTDSLSNVVSISTAWAARATLVYKIPFSRSFGLRPEAGAMVGKFSPPKGYTISNTNATYNSFGGALYLEGTDLSTELRYFRELSQLSRTSGTILTLHSSQTNRVALRVAMTLIPATLKSSSIMVGGEYAKLFTDSSALSGPAKGTGWGVFLRSGFMFVQLNRDHYTQPGTSNNSTILSVGFDGLKLGF